MIQGLGLAIGAAFMDLKKATTLASVTMMAFMLAGGFFVQVNEFVNYIQIMFQVLLCLHIHNKSPSPRVAGALKTPNFRNLCWDSAKYRLQSFLSFFQIFCNFQCFFGLGLKHQL